MKSKTVCTVTSVPVNSLCTSFGYIVRKLKCCVFTNAVAYMQTESCSKVSVPQCLRATGLKKAFFALYFENWTGTNRKNVNVISCIEKVGPFLWDIYYMISVFLGGFSQSLAHSTLNYKSYSLLGENISSDEKLRVIIGSNNLRDLNMHCWY